MRLTSFLFALSLALGFGCKPTTGGDPRVANTPQAAASAAQRPGSVWWVAATFEPREASIAGIPVQQFDSSWATALILDRSELPPEAATDPSSLADSTVRFTWVGDFDRDGTPDRAVVGTYRTNAGTTGRFFAILSRRDERPTATVVGRLAGPPGFSGLLLRGDTLAWAECMQCDSYWEFAWDGDSYEVVPSTFDAE